MKKYILWNNEAGVILRAENTDEAFDRCKETFYGAFGSSFSRPFDKCQVFDGISQERQFKNRLFEKVVFSVMGGNVTTYNADIFTTPTEDQIKFLDNREIEAVIFFNGEQLREFNK